jgi:predicted ATPase/DNA-binding CsgD family transcriptional regulator
MVISDAADSSSEHEHSTFDAFAYINRLAHVASSASQCDALGQAQALAEAQRASMWGLRAAVTVARDEGASWRDLAELLHVAPATLHRQYQQDVGLTVPSGSVPADVLVDDEHGSTANDYSAFGAATLDLFIGRSRELADLPVLLSQRRLVTLIGPGGVGKTRLAAEYAKATRRSYRGGVLWIDLGRLTHASSIEPAIAAAAEASVRGPSMTEALTQRCVTGTVLMVLDNCEHLIDAVAEIAARLLAAHPKLRMLATSREQLQIPGEAHLPVQPLPAVPLDPSDPDLHRSPAVRLFLDRARSAVYDMELAGHARAIAEICNRLDGLPLAIELAARQAAVLPPELLLTRLSERLDLLSGGLRTASPRQQSLRSTIEWSHGLLTTIEQAVFRRVAILPGGFDTRTAGSVTADLELSTAQQWATLSTLANKSLLHPDTSSPGRFRMLESIRAFGAECLDTNKERRVAEAHLVDWLADHAEQQANVLWATSSPQLRARTLAEHENLRYAVDCAARLESDQHAQLTNLFATSCSWRGEFQEARTLLEHLLENPRTGPVQCARALTRLSTISTETGDFAGARRFAQQSLDVARKISHDFLIFKALNILIYAHQDEADVKVAITLNREQVVVLRNMGPDSALSRSLNSLAWMLLIDGRVEAADDTINEAMAVMGSEDPDTLQTAGAIALTLAQTDIATARLRRALNSVPPEQPNTALESIEGLAIAAAQRGDHQRAIQLLNAAAHHRAESGLEGETWWAKQVARCKELVTGGLTAESIAAAQQTFPRISLAEAIRYACETQTEEHGMQPAEIARCELTPTPRERQVLALLASGNTNRQIAGRLDISVRTVTNHLIHIRDKLDLPTRTTLAMWASIHVRELQPVLPQTAHQSIRLQNHHPSGT